MQTRLHSLMESLTNVGIGYAVAILSQMLIFPMFDIHVTLTENLLIGFYFTLVSVARSYALRRLFNRRQRC